MTTLIWIYILLLVTGGVVGCVKAKSQVSLYSSLLFGALLALCALNVIPLSAANWIWGALLLVFVIRLAKKKKFMPAGLMVLVTLLALVLSIGWLGR